MWVCGYDENIYKSEQASLLFDIQFEVHGTSGVDDIAQLCPFLLYVKGLGRWHNLNIKNDTVPIKRGSSVAERST